MLAMIDMSRYPEPEEADDRESAYIWRLLIGADYQGKGYGRAAIAEAEAVAREWRLPRVSLSFVDQPDGPEGFYQKSGFVRTGKLIDGEVQMLKILMDD
ncbi:GNAT family N-acetyltransferase [Loktanella sp. IMCC34160]|nr:GNAT family N-acetyltransferase [Loktanella sp. IMCC34160]